MPTRLRCSISMFLKPASSERLRSAASGLGRFLKSMTAKRFLLKLSQSRQWIAHPVRMPIIPLIIPLILLGLSGSLAFIQPALSYNQKSFLWKVQSDRSTVYLLGSIHFLKEDVYPLNQTIENAYESSDKLVVEANINEIGNLNLKILSDRAFYKNDDHIEKHVSPETYRLIKKESKTLSMPAELIRISFGPSVLRYP